MVIYIYIYLQNNSNNPCSRDIHFYYDKPMLMTAGDSYDTYGVTSNGRNGAKTFRSNIFWW